MINYHITSLARPPVCTCGLLTWQPTEAENLKLVSTFPKAEVISVPIFSWKG